MADKLLDFKQKKQETIEKKRRAFERVMFQNFLGAYAVIDEAGSIYPVNLVDISKTGCLFQVPWNAKTDKQLPVGKEITMRLYFSKDTYIPILVNVKYGKEFHDIDGRTYMRYGSEFDTSMPSFSALESFIEFLYKYAEHSATDRGSNKVYYL